MEESLSCDVGVKKKNFLYFFLGEGELSPLLDHCLRSCIASKQLPPPLSLSDPSFRLPPFFLEL